VSAASLPPPGAGDSGPRPGRRSRAERRAEAPSGPGRARRARKVSLVGLFLLGQVLFLFSHVFRLEEVVVRGHQRLSEQAVVRQAALAPGTYLWALSPRRIAARLHGLREVRTVSVSLALPGRVTLEIRERQPVAVLAASDGAGPWLEVDAEGVLLGQARAPVTVPRLKLKGLDPARGVVDATPILVALKARRWLEPNLPAPAEGYLVDDARAVSVETRLLGTPLVVRVGPLQNMEYKMHVLRAIIDRLKTERRAAVVIDLRYSSPVVRPLKPEPVPSPTP